MAIDAVIGRAIFAPDIAVLYLEPRIDENGNETLPGQHKLIIEGKMKVHPRVGDQIWGGADSVHLVRDGNEIAVFKRDGFGKLVYQNETHP